MLLHTVKIPCISQSKHGIQEGKIFQPNLHLRASCYVGRKKDAIQSLFFWLQDSVASIQHCKYLLSLRAANRLHANLLSICASLCFFFDKKCMLLELQLSKSW